jgi:hypothetical protein
MIEAVTYGMIPSANREKRDSAEPEKRFSRPSTVPPLFEKYDAIWSELIPGAGIQEPSR